MRDNTLRAAGGGRVLQVAGTASAGHARSHRCSARRAGTSSRRVDDPKLVGTPPRARRGAPPVRLPAAARAASARGTARQSQARLPLYKAAGLAVRRRSRRKLRAARPCLPVPVTRAERALVDGLRSRLPRRRAPAAHVQRRRRVHARVPRHRGRHVAAGARVVRVLDKSSGSTACRSRSASTTGRSSSRWRSTPWAAQHGVKLDFIQPGKPTQNAHVESLQRSASATSASRRRDSRRSPERAPRSSMWRVDYNCERPHSSLDYETPKAFGDKARRKHAAFGGGCRRHRAREVRQRRARHRDRDGVERPNRSQLTRNRWTQVGGQVTRPWTTNHDFRLPRLCSVTQRLRIVVRRFLPIRLMALHGELLSHQLSTTAAPVWENEGPVSRRLGCVIPLALLGAAFSIGGASIVYDLWSNRGVVSSSLLLVCIVGGPGLLLFARRVYRDPSF